MDPLTGRLDQNGALQVLLALILSLVCVSGFGLWGVMRHWRFVMETQLRLNECVGLVAQDFRTQLNKIESSNLRIRALRVSIAAAHAVPALIPPLEAALQFEVLQQDSILVFWKLRCARWLVEKGCRQRGDLGWPLPNLIYFRSPPDSIGPQELQWPGVMPEEFYFQARHAPRISSAVVKKEKNGNQFQSSWKAFWSPPFRISRTGFP